MVPFGCEMKGDLIRAINWSYHSSLRIVIQTTLFEKSVDLVKSTSEQAGWKGNPRSSLHTSATDRSEVPLL